MFSNQKIFDFNFIPFEDFAGLTFSNGFQNILVPESGSKDYDTFENNISLNRKQIRENTVRKLLEKLPIETINLDPYLIGQINPTSK